MKAYIGNVNWAYEGDVFFFSVENEENLEAMKSLINILVELNLFYSLEMYWGTKEFFDFDENDFLGFINEANDISEEELAIFNKFKISGFDIFKRILGHLQDLIWDCNIKRKDLDKIKPFYLKLYKQEEWDKIQQQYNTF